MKLVKQHRKIPARVSTSKGNENQEPVQKVPRRVKGMDMLNMAEKVENIRRKAAIQGKLNSEEARKMAGPIRIQLEDVKGKVRALSPAALQFIGPGDR